MHRIVHSEPDATARAPTSTGDLNAILCHVSPTLENDGWQLESAVDRHAEAPETFEIPPEAIRSRLVPESDAKLIFTLRSADGNVVVERMWVRVTGYTDDGYQGVLNNEPTTPGVPISLGDRVVFRPDHIIDTLPPESWDPETRTYRD